MNNGNNPDLKTIYKVIFEWEDEKEEKWLEQMAEKGWRLVSVAPCVYKFQRSESEKVVFRLDYKMSSDKDYQEYLMLFKDAGWELFATFSNWHYFKIKPENKEVPEIYNSSKSKAQKYRRLLKILPGVLALVPPYWLLFSPSFGFINYGKNSTFTGFLLVLHILFILSILITVGVALKVWFKIKKLESESKE